MSKKTKLIYIILLSLIIGTMLVFLGTSKKRQHRSIFNPPSADSLITEVCDTLSLKWSFDQKQVNVKDRHQKDSIRIDFNWDSDSKKWLFTQKIAFEYDKNGAPITQTCFSYQPNSNQWQYSSKLESVFIDGDKISETNSNWNAALNQWVAFLKTEFSYNSSGNDTLESFYIRKAGSENWQISCKIENHYDLSGNKKTRIDYVKSEETRQWEYLCKYEYQYDQANLLTHQKYYYWHADSKTWANYSITENKYHQNLISQVNHQQWLFSQKKWFLDNRTVYYWK